MIHTSIGIVPPGDIARFAWATLMQHQNVAYVASLIERIHNVPKSHSKNVIKQAEQIRYCIVQANEYFSAAKMVSMATKPLLLYYGTMSLALAEILLKGSGNQSLDRARGEHAHHGLTLKIKENPSRIFDLAGSAAAIGATPLIKESGKHFGTFELWHKYSREDPLSGIVITHVPNGTQTRKDVLMNASDVRMGVPPEKGWSLLDCFRSHPRMMHVMRRNGIRCNVARAKLDVNIRDSGNTYQLTIQPNDNALLDILYSKILMHPSAAYKLTVVEFNSGIMMSWTDDAQNTLHVALPPAVQEWADEFHFGIDDPFLNEFGALYYGIYMIGNYVRYYPDQWMVDIENCSPLALACREFTDIVEERVPLLALSELSRTWYVRERQ